MKLLLLLLSVITINVNCAKILGAFFFPSVSHQIVYQPIWKELSLRGHEVTILTPNPLKDPSLVNLTEIDLNFSYKIIDEYDLQNNAGKSVSSMEMIRVLYDMLFDVTETQLASPEVQALINDRTKKFDVLLAEYFHPAFYFLSSRFNCPMIGITSFDAPLNAQDSVGNPSHPVLNPDVLLPLSSTGIMKKITSTLHSVWYRYYYYYNQLPRIDEMVRKNVEDDFPYLGDIERNVSMVFVNTNPVLHPIKPRVPAIIELGKMHLTKPKHLPKDLQEELDSATQGVVYFNLGSNVKNANISLGLRTTVIEALSELPYKVLWKWETDYLPNQPKNVVTRKWMPQQDVLAHPNIKVFVTQGGLQSMEEAITHKVPLVGMPFFVDQPLNVRKMVELGIARAVDSETFTKEELKAAIVDVAENPKYRKRISEISDLSSDVPMSGLDKAVWWIEYVIRHKGARHLRSLAIDMPLYEYFLLDVLAVILTATALALFITYKLILLVIKLYRKTFTPNQKTKVS